jgi:hypothetical protein
VRLTHEECLLVIAQEVRESGVFTASDGYLSSSVMDRDIILTALADAGIDARNEWEQRLAALRDVLTLGEEG